jgi:hypothetical protein
MAEVVLFVPGFFGFGAFGHPDRPLIEYFARVEDALMRVSPGGARPLHFEVHQPPPAGSLAERVRSLHTRAMQVLQNGAERLVLVGHSSGGLDARLLAHPLYRALPDRAELIARIGTVVTISAPFHGTPLARRAGPAAAVAMPALWFGSILASRGRLRIAGQVGSLVRLLRRATRQQVTPTDQLIGELADVDYETAHQIQRFLGDVARDHRLIDDLAPEAMTALNQGLRGGDVVPVHSFVSVAPAAPALDLRAFLRAPLQRILFDLTRRLATAAPEPGTRLPQGPWIGDTRVELRAGSNDGIVPAWSQTLEGVASGIVVGDHLDVIGHYESANATFLSSGSRFDDARFRALWRAVADALG